MTSPKKDFSFGLKGSFLLHGVIFMFFVVKRVAFPEPSLTYFPTLRVDWVALPDVLKQELSQPLLSKPLPEERVSQPEKTQKIITAPPEEMVFKPKKAVPSRASARLKKMKNSLARIQSLNKIFTDAEEPPPLVIKGNKISKGSSLSGEAREMLEVSFYDTLRDHLQAHWALPVWIARQNYAAKIQVYIDDRGRLHHYKFLKPSGNSQFDEAVKRALIESDPYPLPPAALGRTLLFDGILVGFPL